MWVLILEAAQYDPLRAQEIEENISQVWWERWLIDRAAQSKSQKVNQKRNKK